MYIHTMKFGLKKMKCWYILQHRLTLEIQYVCKKPDTKVNTYVRNRNPQRQINGHWVLRENKEWL